MALNPFASAQLVNGLLLNWVGVYDDVADTVTIDCTYTRWPSGETITQPPTAAGINVTLTNGQKVTLDFVSGGTTFDGGDPLMLNSGPRVRTNTRLRLSQGRSRALEHDTFLTP